MCVDYQPTKVAEKTEAKEEKQNGIVPLYITCMCANRAQNNILQQVIFQPTLLFGQTSRTNSLYISTGKPMIVCNNVRISSEWGPTSF